MIMKHKYHQTNQGFVLQALFLYAIGKDKIEWLKKMCQLV